MHDDRTSDQVSRAVATPPPYGVVWRALGLVFAALVCVCASWIATAGLTAALFDEAFDYLAIATLVLGIGLAWRVALRRLRSGVGGDARNAMERTRAGWFGRRRG
jgi:hypothetical protein